MAVRLSSSDTTESNSDIWIAEFGVLSVQYFDFEKKRYSGKVYRLSPESLKSLTESLGFSAKFDAANVRFAYLDVYKSDAIAVVETTRNTKPGDVGLRYSSERWLASEAFPAGNEGLRPWRRTNYRARSLPEQVLLALCDAARIGLQDREKFFVRINFKDGTCGLISEEKNLSNFPGSAYSAFSLPLAGLNVIQPQQEDDEKMSTSLNQDSNIKSSPGASVSDSSLPSTSINDRVSQSGKYATYSRSEVDQLIRQQNDQLMAAIGTKVASQRKELQEALKSQEKGIAKITDELHVYSENVKKQLGDLQTKKHAAIDESVGQARQELAAQIEQFKTHVNKSVIPSLKNLDDRVRKIIESNTPPDAKQQDKSNGQIVLILAAVALLISVFNSVLLLARH